MDESKLKHIRIKVLDETYFIFFFTQFNFFAARKGAPQKEGMVGKTFKKVIQGLPPPNKNDFIK